MLQVIENWIRALKDVEGNMLGIVEDALKEPYIEAKIIDDNVAQMNAGKDAGNNNIEPPYTELTKKIKATKGQPTTKVTLRDEGDFHSSVRVNYLGNRLFIDATDWKFDKLGKKYGFQIMGLTDEHLAELRIEVHPEILSRVKTRLFT